MIHLLLRVEDFPVQSLPLLSHTVRRKLFFGLSYVDILHLGDSLVEPSDRPADVAARMIDARRYLLDALFSGSSACPGLSLNIGSALSDHHDDPVIHAHVCESYPSLEPTSIYGFLFPKRSLPFIDLQSRLNDPLLRFSLVCPPLIYCNMQSVPTERLKIDIHDFKTTAIWKEFEKYMTGIRNDTLVSVVSNPKIYLAIPCLQEFLSNVEVLEIGTYTTEYQSPSLVEDTYIITYVILYNILASSQPRLKHIKVYGIPDTIQRVISTVVELVNATCTTPSKSTLLMHAGLEPPLSLPTTPHVLEGISILPYDEYSQNYDFEFTTASCSSSISRDLMSVLELHMLKLKSVTVNDLGYCCDLDRMTIVDGHVTSGKTNINVPEYRAFLALLVEFIKQPQLAQLTVISSPLPEGFELILTFLCTPASHEQSLTIEASAKRSVEEAEEVEDNDNEEEEDEENWVVNEKDDEVQEGSTGKRSNTCETPPKKKFKYDLPMKPPCFPSQPLPLTNAQYKCLSLGRSSDCVYSWLFHQLPELKLKSLKVRPLDMALVPANVVIQTEHVAFDLFYSHKFGNPTISEAHLEKFVISNSALRRLEFAKDRDEENTESILPVLNHCLLKLDQQGRGLEKLILTFVQLEKFDRAQLREFFVHVRDHSHRYNTTLVLSLYRFCKIAESDFFTGLSEEFQAKKIKKIVCKTPDVDPTPQLELVAEAVTVKPCEPPDVYYW